MKIARELCTRGLGRALGLLLSLGVACDEPLGLEQLEDSVAPSQGLVITARGGALTSLSSSEELRHHLARVIPSSPELIIDLSHKGCLPERVSILIPQGLRRAKGTARAYLAGSSARDQAIERATVGLAWQAEPSARAWSPLSPPLSLELSHPSPHESVLSLELNRGDLSLQPIPANEAIHQRLLESLSSARSLNDPLIPTPPALSPRAPCATLNRAQLGLSEDPLTVRVSLELSGRAEPELASVKRFGLISGLRWSEARAEELSGLFSELNDAELDLVILLGDLSATPQLEALEGLTRALGTLEAPWVTSRGDEDSWASGAQWFERFGFSSFGFDHGGLRFGLLDTSSGAVGERARELVKAWGSDAELLWPHRPAPTRRLLLSHLPILSAEPHAQGSSQRSDAVRLLNLAVESELKQLISAGHAEAHPGLSLLRVPDLSRERAWLEIVSDERCEEQQTEPQQGETLEACLTITQRELPEP